MPLVEVLDSYCYIWCCCASSLLTAFCVEGVPCIHLAKCVRCSVLQIDDVLGRLPKLLYLNLLSGVTRLSLLPGWWESVNFDKTHPTLGNLFLSQFGSEINKKLSPWKLSCVAGRRLSMTCDFVMYVMRCKLSMCYYLTLEWNYMVFSLVLYWSLPSIVGGGDACCVAMDFFCCWSVWMDYMNVLILHLFWRLLLLLMHVGVPFKFCCWGHMMVSYCNIVDVCAKLDAKFNIKSQPISILYKTIWSKTHPRPCPFCINPFDRCQFC